jgi:hypothetical protein
MIVADSRDFIPGYHRTPLRGCKRPFCAPWASGSLEDAPGDDRTLNHPGATEVGESLTHPPDAPPKREKIVREKGTYSNI